MPGPARYKKQDAFLVVISINPRALRTSPLSSLCAAGHVDTLAVDECICDLAPGFMQVAPRGLARDSEFFCFTCAQRGLLHRSILDKILLDGSVGWGFIPEFFYPRHLIPAGEGLPVMDLL